MSELLRIKPVSSKSKIETLREFGHRAFAEIGDDGKPVGYWVETKETAGIQVSAPQRGRRHAVSGNVALVWAGKPLKVTIKDSLFAKIGALAKDYAAHPARRDELVAVLTKESKATDTQVTNVISRLTTEGYLVVPG